MRDIATARADLLASHPTLSVFFNSEAWRAVRRHLADTGPSERLADVPPEEMVTKGVIYAAQIQGRIDALRDLDALADVREPQHEPEATYLGDDFTGDVPDVELAPTPKRRKK